MKIQKNKEKEEGDYFLGEDVYYDDEWIKEEETYETDMHNFRNYIEGYGKILKFLYGDDYNKKNSQY